MLRTKVSLQSGMAVRAKRDFGSGGGIATAGRREWTLTGERMKRAGQGCPPAGSRKTAARGRVTLLPRPLALVGDAGVGLPVPVRMLWAAVRCRRLLTFLGVCLIWKALVVVLGVRTRVLGAHHGGCERQQISQLWFS